MDPSWVGVKEYHTECSLPVHDGSSAAAVASAVLMLSVNGNAEITVGVSKSSLAGCARAAGTFNRANSSPATLTTTNLRSRSRRIWASSAPRAPGDGQWRQPMRWAASGQRERHALPLTIEAGPRCCREVRPALEGRRESARRPRFSKIALVRPTRTYDGYVPITRTGQSSLALHPCPQRARGSRHRQLPPSPSAAPCELGSPRALAQRGRWSPRTDLTLQSSW